MRNHATVQRVDDFPERSAIAIVLNWNAGHRPGKLMTISRSSRVGARRSDRWQNNFAQAFQLHLVSETKTLSDPLLLRNPVFGEWHVSIGMNTISSRVNQGDGDEN